MLIITISVLQILNLLIVPHELKITSAGAKNYWIISILFKSGTDFIKSTVHV